MVGAQAPSVFPYHVLGYTDEYFSHSLSGINGHHWKGDVLWESYDPNANFTISQAAYVISGQQMMATGPMTELRTALCKSPSDVSLLTPPASSQSVINWDITG